MLEHTVYIWTKHRLRNLHNVITKTGGAIGLANSSLLIAMHHCGILKSFPMLHISKYEIASTLNRSLPLVIPIQMKVECIPYLIVLFRRSLSFTGVYNVQNHHDSKH